MPTVLTAALVNDDGASLVEYALLLCLLSVIVMASLHTIGNKVANDLSNVSNGLS